MKKHWLMTALLFANLFVSAQTDRMMQISSFPDTGLVQQKGWKYFPENGSDYSAYDLDDKDWPIVNADTTVGGLAGAPLIRQGWYRVSFSTSTSFKDSLAVLVLEEFAQTRIYFDGRLLKQDGVVDEHSGLTNLNAHRQVLPIFISAGRRHVIAIRFRFVLPSNLLVKRGSGILPISVRIQSLPNLMKWISEENKDNILFDGLAILNLAFFLLFALLYIFYPRQRLNLYFSLFSMFIFLLLVFSWIDASVTSITWNFWIARLNDLNGRLIGTMILCFMSVALFGKVLRVFRIYNLLMLAIEFPLSVIFPFIWPASIVFQGVFMLMAFVLAVYSVLKRKKEERLIGLIGLSVGLINFDVLVTAVFHQYIDIIPYFVNIVIPLAMTIYLSLRYAGTSVSLEKQLDEVKKLSDENLQREKEKQELLTTQNERLESQVSERTAALNNSLNELKSTQAQLVQSEKMASLGELTAGIAHEIQNPLNFVNNFSEINLDLFEELKSERTKTADERNGQLETELIDDLRANEEKIHYHGKRADAIVKGMLQHSRKESGVKEAADLNAMAAEYLALAYHGFRAKNPEFQAELIKDLDLLLPAVPVIPQEIGRVLLNLFNNAFYSMAEKAKQTGNNYSGSLNLQTRIVAKEIRISVSDNGMGIAPDLAEKIFQPFFTTKPAGSGTGLGLSLSYDIIKAHGGRISASSEEKGITSFVIVLPVSR